MIPTADQIFSAVHALTGVTLAESQSASRLPRLVRARELYCFCLHEFAGMSYPEIARTLGKVSHSGVLESAARFDGRMKEALMKDKSIEPLLLRHLARMAEGAGR